MATSVMTFSSSVWRSAEQPNRFYIPQQVALASVLGGSIGGSVLMAANYRRLGQERKANITVLLGFVAVLPLVGLAMLLPSNLPLIWFSIVLAIVVRGVALATQGELLDHQLQNGGEPHSIWRAGGIGLAAGLAYFAIAVAGFIIVS